jgi:ligand-binding sensor domain-containing protein
VTVSGFSRRWIPAAGIGHVFESTDGGATFTDISADLPDIPANDIVDVGGSLVVATDVGVFVNDGGSWSEYGAGLPQVSVLDLTLQPGGSLLMATTHGRGVWLLDASS